MTKISVHEDFVDSPHKEFIKDFNVAFAKGDVKYVLNCFSDDILWNVINHEPVRGKKAVEVMLRDMDEVADELVIENIISDGDKCAIYGQLTYGDSAVAFSDIYIFDRVSADIKIKSLIGYAINVKEA